MREIVVYSLMFSAMLQLLMAVYAWGRRREPAAWPLISFFILGAVWALAYGLDMASSDLALKLVWAQVYFTAASFGPLIELAIVLQHLELARLLKRWHLALLMVPALILIALVWTVPYHNLLLNELTVERVGPLDVLRWKEGVLFSPIFVALQGISLIAYFYLIRSFSNANPIKRKQSIAILCAMLTLFIVNIPNILDISPIKGFDFTPNALVISSGLFAFAIFRYRWLDILPLARTTLVETIPMGVVVLDAKNRVVDINPAAQQLLRVSVSIIGEEALAALTDFGEVFRSQVDTEMYKKEVDVNVYDEQPEHFEVQVMPIKDQTGQYNGRIVMFYDITERKQFSKRLQAQLAEIESLHAQLTEQAIRDSLTGLYNRRYLMENLEREFLRATRTSQPLSIILMDIDHFKALNDTYGHLAGDACLKEVADLLHVHIRKSDIASRYGGEEFLLVLTETNLEVAIQRAEQFRLLLANTIIRYESREIKVTASLGISSYPLHHCTNVDEIIGKADVALYESKRSGRDQITVWREELSRA